MAGRAHHFTIASFGWRLLIALALVLITYNPSGTSYSHWIRDATAQAGLRPEHFLVAVVLIIGWVMFVRATLRSQGGVGILLGAGFFAALMWLLTYYQIVPADSATAIVWIALICLTAR